MPYMSANSYFGLAAESTYGTAASISTYTPIGNPKIATGLKWLDDTDFRGSPVMHYDQVPGVRADKFEGKTFMYTDVYPNLIRAVLGGTDSVSSSVHTIGVGNFPNQGSQAPSYTIINNSVDGTYQLTASRCVELAIAFNADAAVETTFSFTGNAASVVASATPNESTQHLIPSWNCSASINGASVAVVESASIDIKRNTAPIHTIGSQTPYNNFQGPIEVSGQLSLVVEAGEPYFNQALTRTQIPIIFRFTDPATGYYVQFQMSNCQLEDPVIDQAKAYISLQAKYIAIANTTDAISGYSPIISKTYNNIATAY